MRRRFGFLGLAMALCTVPSLLVVSNAGPSLSEGVMPRLPKKALKAAKRLKTAERVSGWPRSKNAPPKRKLRRNLITHSRRVRRKHRRARKAA